MIRNSRIWTSLINYSLFQAGWFICILGTAAGHPWPATVAGVLLVVVHLALVRDRSREVVLLLGSLLLGLLVDAIHIGTGVLVFTSGSLHAALPPPWILILWLQFAMTLHYSLAWLNGRFFLGSVLGAVSGALAYWAGVRFGAAAFGAELTRSLVQIGLSWSIVLFILLKLSLLTAPKNGTATYRCFQAQ